MPFEKYYVHRGELKARALARQLLDVPPTIESKQVEIITLSQHIKEQALEYAFTITPDCRMVGDTVEKLMDSRFYYAKEFIRVDTYITVGVNARRIDDAAIEHAIQLMLKANELKEGLFQEFGERVPVIRS